MAIQYSGGPYSNTSTLVATPLALLQQINTVLTANGWTSEFFNETIQIQFTGNPVAGDTITLAGVVYTAAAAPGAANTFVINAASSYETYRNLKAAVNGDPGSGVLYGAGTVANPNVVCSGVWLDNAITFSNRNPGVWVLAVALTNTVPVILTPFFQWYCWSSPANSQGLRWSLLGGYGEIAAGLDQCRLYIAQPERVSRSYRFPTTNFSEVNSDTPGERLKVPAPINYRIIASRANVFVYEDGVAAASALNRWGCAGSVYISNPESLPLAISNITLGASPVITTSANHNFTTGDIVCLRNVLGIPNAAITATCTVLTPTTFQLPASVNFQGAYIGGGIVGKASAAGTSNGRTCEAAWQGGSSASLRWFRGALTPGVAGAAAYGIVWNGNSSNGVSPPGAGIGSPDIYTLVRASSGTLGSAIHSQGAYAAAEAIIGFGTTAASTNWIIGQLWDMAIVLTPITRDLLGTFEGFSFLNLTDQNAGSAAPVYIAGSAIIRVA